MQTETFFFSGPHQDTLLAHHAEVVRLAGGTCVVRTVETGPGAHTCNMLVMTVTPAHREPRTVRLAGFNNR